MWFKNYLKTIIYPQIPDWVFNAEVEFCYYKSDEYSNHKLVKKEKAKCIINDIWSWSQTTTSGFKDFEHSMEIVTKYVPTLTTETLKFIWIDHEGIEHEFVVTDIEKKYDQNGVLNHCVISGEE